MKKTSPFMIGHTIAFRDLRQPQRRNGVQQNRVAAGLVTAVEDRVGKGERL